MMRESQENFKEIHIGKVLQIRVEELNISEERIAHFINCEKKNIGKFYESESIDTKILLRWSKLLKYDFFRFYSQHLILYAPSESTSSAGKTTKLSLPEFRKNIYTKEMIDFILEMINTGKKTKIQVVEEYRIPKTTLYKWIKKYSS